MCVCVGGGGGGEEEEEEERERESAGWRDTPRGVLVYVAIDMSINFPKLSTVNHTACA